MGLLSIIKKVKAKEKEMRILMVYGPRARSALRHAARPCCLVARQPSTARLTRARAGRSGLDNAGKTTVVKRLNGEDITTISPTLGFNIKTMTYDRRAKRSRSRPSTCAAVRVVVSPLLRFMGAAFAVLRAARSTGVRRRYTLNVWDVGGQKTLRAYWRNYYEATDGLVWVVDAADAARLPDCAAELRALLAEEKARSHRHVTPFTPLTTLHSPSQSIRAAVGRHAACTGK